MPISTICPMIHAQPYARGTYTWCGAPVLPTELARMKRRRRWDGHPLRGWTMLEGAANRRSVGGFDAVSENIMANTPIIATPRDDA
jgi:hypothetical protein